MTDKPAMTMREIRERLGYATPGIPDPIITATRYVVSCLPEGHDERWTYTVQVEYRNDDLYVVTQRLKFANAEGAWEYEPNWPEDGSEADAEDAWLAAHRFDHDTALRLARRLAKTLTCRGRTVADVLADGAA
jgi:hypothetical protein